MAESPILYSSESFVIADKSHGIPTVPLKGQSTEGTLLGQVAALFPDVMDVVGRNPWEHGAVHRLDTATGGLVVFARTQSFYDHLQRVQAAGSFKKTYVAHCFADDRLRGFDASFNDASLNNASSNKDGVAEISSYFRSYGPGAKQVRPTLDIKRADSEVLYTTIVKRLGESDFECTIARGFRHQIRAHLAWIGYPIVGDVLYGNGKENDNLQLDCVSLSFPLENDKIFSFGK